VAPKRSETLAEPPPTANLPSRGAFLGGVPGFRGPDGTGSQVLWPGSSSKRFYASAALWWQEYAQSMHRDRLPNNAFQGTAPTAALRLPLAGP
jgi:hypothetical protein